MLTEAAICSIVGYEMKRRYLSAIILLVLLLGAGSYTLVRSTGQPARAAPPPRPLSDPPWSTDDRVSDDPGTFAQYFPMIAVDPNGNAHAIWYDCRTGLYCSVYSSYREAGGEWELNTRVVDDEVWEAASPSVAIDMDGAGNAYAIWVDHRNNPYGRCYADPTDYSCEGDVYFSYRPAGGTWSTNERVNDVVSSADGSADGLGVAIGVDEAGNALALWVDIRNDPDGTCDEETCEMDLFFDYRPAGGAWSTDGIVSDVPGALVDGSRVALAVDRSGNAYVIWYDERPPHLYFTHSLVAGEWAPSEPIPHTTTIIEATFGIAINEAGDAWAIWIGMRDWVKGVYAAHRPVHGAWEAEARIDDDPTSSCWFYPDIAVDAVGNVHAVWMDGRGSPSGCDRVDIYSAYRAAGGNWQANVRVTDGADETPWNWCPSVDLDGQGNAYVVWSDGRSDNGDIYFSYRPAPDTDGDGLLDRWEEYGIDINDDGTVDLDLPAMGADPMHKDIFIEVDYMERHRPNASAIQDVINAFAGAPVSNPDAVGGINLHVVVDEEIPHQETINVWADFDTLKDAHFGTIAERSSANWNNIRQARRMVFRYALFVHEYNSDPPGSSGRAEIGGNDFIVSLGAPGWGKDGTGHNVGTRDEQAGTFMHELGHTLGLHHGGGDDINCKPNYLSVMSYSRQLSDIVLGRALDYSRSELPALVENNLDEWLGVQGSSSALTVYGPPRDVDSDGDLDYPIASAFGPIDWDGDGFMEGESVAGNNVWVNINYLPPACPDPDDTQTLTSHNDWANLLYNFRTSPDYADGVHVLVADEELTDEVVEEMREIADFHKVYLPLILRNY